MLCSVAGSKCLLWVIYTWSKAEVQKETQSCKDLGYFCKRREGSKHMNSSFPQPLELQLDQLLFQKHDWAGINSRLCSKSAGENNQSGIRKRASSEDTTCNTLGWWVGVCWLGNSHYLCWEGEQFLLKLPCFCCIYDNAAKTRLQYESQNLEICQLFKSYLIP